MAWTADTLVWVSVNHRSVLVVPLLTTHMSGTATMLVWPG